MRIIIFQVLDTAVCVQYIVLHFILLFESTFYNVYNPMCTFNAAIVMITMQVKTISHNAVLHFINIESEIGTNGIVLTS